MILKYDTIYIPKNSPLETICEPVKDFNSTKVLKIIEDMKDIIKNDSHAYGIAANQLSYDLRIIAMINPDNSIREPLIMINPFLSWVSSDRIYAFEGCLSFPDLYVNIKRPDMVTIEFQDERAGQNSLTLTGLYARIIQHELDHIDGVPFFRRATTYHLEQAVKKWKKNKD